MAMSPNLVLSIIQIGLVAAGMWWHGATEQRKTSSFLVSNAGSGDMIFHVHAGLVEQIAFGRLGRFVLVCGRVIPH